MLRYFRKDGHNWRKKKDGKTVKEAHERLKVCAEGWCLFIYGRQALFLSGLCLDETTFADFIP